MAHGSTGPRIALAAVVVALLARGAAAEDLRLAGEDGQALEEVVLVAAGDGASFSKPIWIRQGGTAAAKAELAVTEVVDALARPPRKGSIALTLAGGEAAGSVDVTTGAGTPLVLVAKDLDLGVYTASVEANKTRIARVRVRRVPWPEVEVDGVRHGEALQYEATAAGWFERTLKLTLANDSELEGPEVSMVPLVGPELKRVVCDLRIVGAPHAVAPGSPLELKLTATLPRPGSYTGLIRVVDKDRRKTTCNVTVTVPAPTLAIDVDGGGAAGLGTTWLRWQSSATFTFDVMGTKAEGDVTIDPPTLSFALKGTNNRSDTQTPSPPVVELKDEAGQPLVSVRLRGLESRRVTAMVEGLGQPGEYKVTVRTKNAAGTGPEKTLTVFVGDEWLVAVGLVAAGVVLSYLIRRWFRSGRPRRLWREKIELLDGRFDDLVESAGELDTEEKRVVAAIRATLDDVSDKLALESEDPSKVDATLDTVDVKRSVLASWLEGRRRVLNLRPESIRGPLLADLAGVATFLTRTDTDAANARRALDALPGKITGAVVAALKAGSDALAAALAQLDPGTPGRAAADDARDRARSLIEVLPDTADDAAVGVATKALEKARIEYVRLVADGLGKVLRGPPPPDFDAEVWRRLGEDLAELHSNITNNPADAVATFGSLQARYVRAMAQYIFTKATDWLASKVDQDTNLTTVQQTELKEKLTKVIEQLRTSAFQPTPDKLLEIWKTFLGVRDAMKAPGGPLGPSTAESRPQRAALAATIEAVADRHVRVEHRVPLAKLRASRVLADTVIDGVIVAISVGVGLWLLKVSEPTWGGWDTEAAAIFWGLGLHQVAGAGFDVSGIRDKLVK